MEIPAPWSTELTGSVPFDEILSPELRLACVAGSGGFEGTYVGPSLNPELLVDHLRFSAAASGTLTKGSWELYFKGKPELTAQYKIRGN